MKRKNEAYWSDSQQRWQINVQVDGKRRTFVCSKKNADPENRKGKIEAEQKADTWIRNRLSGENTQSGKLMDAYLESVKARSTGPAYEQNEKFIRLYIRPALGHTRISSITLGRLQDILDACYSQKHLSKKTLMDIRGCISGWIKWCRLHGHTTLLTEGITIPAGAKESERSILSPVALNTLFSVSNTEYRGKRKEEPFIWAFRFAVVTGLRPGELIGLQQMDIADGKYTIRRSINDDGKETRGKNHNARRTGELGDIGNWILDEQRKSLASECRLSKYVFPDADGGYITQKKFYFHWKRYCASNGIDQGTKPYELRHTFCSINDEMPDGLKKMVMGHSKNMDTQGIYGHQKSGDLERAAAYIDEAFQPYAKLTEKR